MEKGRAGFQSFQSRPFLTSIPLLQGGDFRGGSNVVVGVKELAHWLCVVCV